jgi:predicted HicB family RNase H-like nuclease
MSSKILFGNSVGYKINNYLIKKKIIDYLQDNIDVFRFNDNLILNEDDLLTIKNQDYIIVPNIVGEDYIFVGIKLKENYFVVLIEKKTLSDFKNINYNNLNIISIQIRLKVDTYKGTIFDGRVVNLGGCCAFIINKVHMLNGDNLNGKNIYEIYKLTEDFISESYVIDPNMNTILFKLNRIYELNEMETLINEKIPNSKFKFSSLDFISNDCCKTFRYYYTNQDYDVKSAVMFGKLINVDVVELFSKDDNDKIKRIGIAHIPDIKTSQICNQYISGSELTPIKCKLNYRFKKWVPEEIYLENKDINSYEDITNKMLDVISH